MNQLAIETVAELFLYIELIIQYWKYSLIKIYIEYAINLC